MTRLGLLNFFVLQWFGVRLAKLSIDEPWFKGVGWGLLFPVCPLTGWWTEFWPRDPKLIDLHRWNTERP